jgi:predicted RNase H-like HicB family nuclease
MEQPFTASLTKEDSLYIAQCLEIDIASQGESEAEALGNLKEALELHFELPVANKFPKILHLLADVGASYTSSGMYLN